jgi:hypothetical protein
MPWRGSTIGWDEPCLTKFIRLVQCKFFVAFRSLPLERNELMPTLQKPKYITFDCYGTLVQWHAALERAVRSVLSGHLRSEFGTIVEPMR